MKNIIALIGIGISLAACSDAQVASNNISRAADNFEINRRIVFYNGITDTYMLEIQGLCSLGKAESLAEAVTVTCKTGQGQYKKHYLGVSDNVTYFAEQLEAAPTNIYHYRVIFKPAAIIPYIEVK
jgi:hypothetical protein